jgi:hypothetical protein
MIPTRSVTKTNMADLRNGTQRGSSNTKYPILKWVTARQSARMTALLWYQIAARTSRI